VCIGLIAWLLAVHTQAPADSTILSPVVRHTGTAPARRSAPSSATEARSRGVADRPPAAFTASRRDAAPAITIRRRLTWPRVAAATFYDVILWQDGKRVLDLWPSTPSVTLPQHWTFGGKRFALMAGGYEWFVYPATGTRATARYGSLAARGSIGSG
jgi:hypothetical protein